MKSDDKSLIDEKIKNLSEASAPLAQRLYEEQAKKAEESSETKDAEPDKDKDVVDADFEEVKEDDKS